MQEKNSGTEKQDGLSWSTPAPSPAQPQKPVQAQQKPPAFIKAPAPAAAASSSTKYAGMIAAGIVAGVIIAWGWSALRTPASETVSMLQGQTNNAIVNDTGLGIGTSTVPALGSDPALTIMSPQPAGNSVAVTKAIVSGSTWVVIYENKDGKPGNALGAALFWPEKQNGTVELLRSTMPGKTYLAVKQTDNGDRKFSLKDDQFLSEGGAVQWVTFETK